MPIPTRYRSRGTKRTMFAKRVLTVREFDYLGNLVNEYNDGGQGEDEYYSPDQWCIDSVGYRYKDNPLYVSYRQSYPARASVIVDATYPRPGGGRVDYVYDYDVGLTMGHALYEGDEEVSDVEFVTKAVAETNPSNAYVQGLAFMAELRDLPSLFQSVGKTMSKFGANEYLKFQYGWRPFVNDMRKVFNVADRVHRRLHAIKRIEKEGTVRRRYRPSADHGGHSFQSRLGQVASGDMIDGGYLAVWGSTEMRTSRWADIVWLAKPPEVLFSIGGNSQMETARKALFGLNVDGPTIWQAMPWSWLADWTYNVSDYIESQNNVVGAEFGEAILMKTTHLSTTGIPFWETPPDSGVSSERMYFGAQTDIIKERILGIEPAVVNTGEFTSILDSEFKTSILLSLGIQRLKGR